MQNLVSLDIITPVGRETDWITNSANSVEMLRLAAKFQINWLLASDGPQASWIEEKTRSFSGNKIIIPSDNSRKGASQARNACLAMGKGKYIMALDDDDMVIPGVVVDMMALAEENDYAWMGARALDLKEKTLHEHVLDPPYPAGPHEKGTFRAYIYENGVQPFTGGGALLQREKAGEWPNLAYHQDTQHLLNITDKYPGYFYPKESYIWRRHPQQMSANKGNRPRLWR